MGFVKIKLFNADTGKFFTRYINTSNIMYSDICKEINTSQIIFANGESMIIHDENFCKTLGFALGEMVEH
jgi:hypothetical protein